MRAGGDDRNYENYYYLGISFHYRALPRRAEELFRSGFDRDFSPNRPPSWLEWGRAPTEVVLGGWRLVVVCNEGELALRLEQQFAPHPPPNQPPQNTTASSTPSSFFGFEKSSSGPLSTHPQFCHQTHNNNSNSLPPTTASSTSSEHYSLDTPFFLWIWKKFIWSPFNSSPICSSNSQ